MSSQFIKLFKNKLFISIILSGILIIHGCSPVIKTINPKKGPVGTLVEIKGKRFGPTAAVNTVKFGNTAVLTSDITFASTTFIKAKVPVGAQTGLVSVKYKGRSDNSDENFRVTGDAKWTFMVYLDADNNLEDAGIDDFLEMATVGSNADVNIVVQMDRINGHSSAYGNWTGTRRFLIQKGDTPSITPIQDLGEQNMGDPNTLQDFVEWAVVNYPAEYYLLSIWNHGDGWRQNRERFSTIAANFKSGPNETLVKAIASDDTDNDILYMKEVQQALNTAKLNLESRNITKVKLDVVGFDACFMGMLEVAYALRGLTNYMVASEETEPADGWPYNTILAALVANPNMPPQNLAKTIVIKYGNSYSSGVTQAAYDMSKVGTLASKVDAFTDKANTEWAIIKNARFNSKDYHPSWYNQFWGTDIKDFGGNVHNSVTNTDIKNAANSMNNAVDDFVIEEHHSSNMSGSNGVAIYFPPTLSSFNNDPQHTAYQDGNTFMVIDYVVQHKWDNWLQKYYNNIP